jgi:hypothetical protein
MLLNDVPYIHYIALEYINKLILVIVHLLGYVENSRWPRECLGPLV